MNPSTRRAAVVALAALLAFGLIATALKGDAGGARDVATAIVGCALFGGLAAMAWWMRTAPRRAVARDAASELGLTSSPTDPFDLPAMPFPLLHRAATVRGIDDVMFGVWQGYDVRLFSYWYARSSNPVLNDFERFSCVVTPLPDWWPDLVIAPDTSVSRVIDHVALREVHLESEAFDRAFSVRSADPRFANALLDARMMQWLLDHTGPWGFEIAGGALLCSHSPELPAWELRPLLETMGGFLEMVPDVLPGLFATGAAGTTPLRPDEGSRSGLQ